MCWVVFFVMIAFYLPVVAAVQALLQVTAALEDMYILRHKHCVRSSCKAPAEAKMGLACFMVCRECSSIHPDPAKLGALAGKAAVLQISKEVSPGSCCCGACLLSNSVSITSRGDSRLCVCCQDEGKK